MKRILLTFVLAGFTVITFAQSIDFGIKAGVDLSSQSINVAYYAPAKEARVSKNFFIR